MHPTSPLTPVSTLPSPSRARYIVLGFLCSMATVLYLDRVCISQALKPIQDEFDLSNTQAGVVLMAFTLAYGLFEIPTGRWSDRYGARRVLTRIVLWWSVFTALTGSVWKFSQPLGILPMPAPLSNWFDDVPLMFDSLVLLVLIRFLFGAGEAGAMPCSARIISLWFPNAERGRVLGFFQASMHVGGTIAPILAAQIIARAGWRWTFLLFGMVGLVWASLFYWWFRDQPAHHPAVNAAEIDLIGQPTHAAVHHHDPIPWREVIAQPNIWLLSIIITLTAFNSYVFFSWYSTYLQKARGLDNEQAGWLAALPLAGATLGPLLGGWLADKITRQVQDRYRARRWLGLVNLSWAACCLFASVQLDVPWLSAFLCALACLLMFCQQPTWWACSFDVCGKHTGALFGLLNGMGVVGAMGSQFFFGAFADWRGGQGYAGREQWDPAFYVCAAFLLLAGVLWQFVRPCKPIGEPLQTV